MKISNLIDEKRIATILNRYGVMQAEVFGSFSRGDMTDDSDLDLLVTYRPGTTLFDVMSLQDELEQVVGRKVDLVSKKSLSGRLEKRIKNDLRPISLG